MLSKTPCEIKKRVNDTEVASMADVTMVWSDTWGVMIGKQVCLCPLERRQKGPSKRSHHSIPSIPRKFKDLVPSRNNRNRQSSIGSRPLFAGRTQIHCCSCDHRTSHLEGGRVEMEPANRSVQEGHLRQHQEGARAKGRVS